MKIGNPVDLFRAGAPTAGVAAADADKARAAAAVPSASPTQPANPEGSATVKLSGGLGTLKASASTEGVFDAKRVEQLRAPVANGSFRVNAEVVATRVIASNLEALTRSKP